MRYLALLLPLQLSTAQCSVANEGGTAVGNQVANSQEDSRERQPGTRQLCDDLAATRQGPIYPNGFLLVWTPNEIDLGSRGMEWRLRRYSAASAVVALDLYREYNRIIDPAHHLLAERDADGLITLYDNAVELAHRVAQTNLVREPVPAALGGDSGFEIEFLAMQLPAHIAYLILTIDEDYVSFEERMERIQTGAFYSPSRFRFREPESGWAVGEHPEYSQISLGFVRALVIYRMLKGNLPAAERAMIFLIEQRVESYPRAYYYPRSTRGLRQLLSEPDLTLHRIVYPEDPEVHLTRRCSDLYAFYVEWLDLSSRVALQTHNRLLALRIRDDVKRLRSLADATLIGERYNSAIVEIMNRLAAFDGTGD